MGFMVRLHPFGLFHGADEASFNNKIATNVLVCMDMARTVWDDLVTPEGSDCIPDIFLRLLDRTKKKATLPDTGLLSD